LPSFSAQAISRAVLPRVLSLAQVENVVRNTPVEIEVFGFGGLCVIYPRKVGSIIRKDQTIGESIIHVQRSMQGDREKFLQ